MTPTIHPDLYGDLIEVASRSDFADWTSMVRSIGGCTEPIHLWGECRAIHAGTGELITVENVVGSWWLVGTGAPLGVRRARRSPGPTPSS